MMQEEHMEILLVEDDPRDMRLTMRELQAASLKTRVEVARDGAEALDFLFCQGDYSQRSPDRPPKLVLLDLKLPKVDGLQVLREIKSNPATQAIPVVILTSSREERDMVESYKLGVNSYIQKPVDFEQFRETIRTLGLYWMGVNQPPPDKTFAND
jgi:two-component system response regulator